MNTILDYGHLSCEPCNQAQVPPNQRLIIFDHDGYVCSHCGHILSAPRADVPRPVMAVLTSLVRRRTFRAASAPTYSSDSNFKLNSEIAAQDEHAVSPPRQTSGEPHFHLGIGKSFTASLRGPVGKMALVPFEDDFNKGDDIIGTISFSRNLSWCLPAPNGEAGFQRRNFPFVIPDVVETAVQTILNELRRHQLIGFVSKAAQGPHRRSLRIEFRSHITVADLHFGDGAQTILRATHTKVSDDQVHVVRMEFSWTESTPGEIFIPIWCSDAAAFLTGDLDNVLRDNEKDAYHVSGHLTLERAHEIARTMRGAWGRDCCILKLQHDPYAIALKVTPIDANLHNFIASQFRHNSISIGGRAKLKLFWPDLKPGAISILPSPQGTRKP